MTTHKVEEIRPCLMTRQPLTASRLAAAVATLQSQKSGASQLQKAMAEVAEQLLASSEAVAPKMALLTAAVSERLKQCLLPAVVQDTQVSKALVTLALQLTKSVPLMAQLGEAEVQMLLLSLDWPSSYDACVASTVGWIGSG